MVRSIVFGRVESFVRAQPRFFPYLQGVGTEARHLHFGHRVVILRFHCPCIVTVVRTGRRGVEFSVFVSGRKTVSRLLTDGRQFLLILPRQAWQEVNCNRASIFIYHVVRVGLPISLMGLQYPRTTVHPGVVFVGYGPIRFPLPRVF